MFADLIWEQKCPSEYRTLPHTISLKGISINCLLENLEGFLEELAKQKEGTFLKSRMQKSLFLC